MHNLVTENIIFIEVPISYLVQIKPKMNVMDMGLTSIHFEHHLFQAPGKF